QAPTVAFGLTELGGQERLDKIPGGLRPDDATAHTNDIHMIILDSLTGREVIEDQTGADARNLVGADGCAHAAAAHRHSALHLTGRHRPSEWNNKIRIVIA